jgi:hypothetical protein
MSEENVDAIRAALEASTGVLSVFDEKAEMIAPDWGLDTGVYRGTEAIRTWLVNWMCSWDEYGVENGEYLDES